MIDEWNGIEIEEVRRRIDEMPYRCELLVKTGGIPIRTKLW